MNENIFLLESSKDSSPIILLSWWLSGLFLLIILFTIFYVKTLRNQLRVKGDIEAKYQEDYEVCLVTYLYAGNEEETFSSEQLLIISELKESVADPFRRKIIISTLLKLRNEISGEMAESIDKLYVKLGLLRYSLAKLRNKKWDVIANGIRELTQFKIKAVHQIVMNNINHPTKEVRKEMQLYLVHLYAFKGLDFLNVLETPLSEWDQIQLLEILQLKNDSEIVDITPWLKSSNDSVVNFTLKLAKVYNQFEAKEELIKLLNHGSEDVRINTISALSHLNVLEAKNILKDSFNERSLEEQIAFLKMMENVYEYGDKVFLQEQMQHENFEIKSMAMEIMKNINFEKYELHEVEIKKPITV